MNDDGRFSIERLAQFTGEPVERLREWRERELIGRVESEDFEPVDFERVRMMQLALRRGISLDAIVKVKSLSASLDESMQERMFGRGLRLRTLEEVTEDLDIDAAFASRVCEAAGLGEARCLNDDDIRMLRGARIAVDAGLPEEALLQVFRVYADTLGRASDAGLGAFHFYVHNQLRAAGVTEDQLMEQRDRVSRATRSQEPTILYFFRKAQMQTTREDRVLHFAEDSGLAPPTNIPGEIDRAIVFVDLSSFTPMTEAMGDPEAAAVLERFSQIVRSACIRNDGRVVKQVGDAFMLAFGDAASATACSLDIVDRAADESLFPAARAGVHWGRVLYREGDYVGSSVNLASRVGNGAGRHQVLLTEAARNEAKSLEDVTFVRLGKRRMKGLPEETVLFEAQREATRRGDRLVDPVCGMEMSADEVAARLTLDGREHSFCSDECLRLYVSAPQRYK